MSFGPIFCGIMTNFRQKSGQLMTESHDYKQREDYDSKQTTNLKLSADGCLEFVKREESIRLLQACEDYSNKFPNKQCCKISPHSNDHIPV